MSGAKQALDLSLLPDGGVRWLDASGSHADIVISTRMRLARNVTGYAFTGRARDGERLRMLAQVRDGLPAFGDKDDHRKMIRRWSAPRPSIGPQDGFEAGSAAFRECSTGYRKFSSSRFTAHGGWSVRWVGVAPWGMTKISRRGTDRPSSSCGAGRPPARMSVAPTDLALRPSS